MFHPHLSLAVTITLGAMALTGCASGTATNGSATAPTTVAPALQGQSVDAPTTYQGGSTVISVTAVGAVSSIQVRSANQETIPSVDLHRVAGDRWTGTLPLPANLRTDGVAEVYPLDVVATTTAGAVMVQALASVPAAAPPPGTPESDLHTY